MINLYLGIGAAGNKIAINMADNLGIIDMQDVRLINSTLKDIPDKYKDSAIRISSGSSEFGAAQERSRGKQMAFDAIQSNMLKLDNIVEPQHQKVVIFTSVAGGTGSGASVVIAKYLREVIKIPVEIYAIMGFEDEAVRSLRNTMEFCQDLTGDYIIQLIRNEAFLKKANGNRLKAEEMVNDLIAKRILMSTGIMLRDCVQNIDEMDLTKLETTPGYKTIEYYPVTEKIKSQDQFNNIIKEILDDTASVDPDDNAGITRLGMIYNLQPSSQENIDYSYSPIIQRLGSPYEIFNHVQYRPDMTEFIALIATGMKMPMNEIRKVYNKYNEQINEVNTTEDNFFESVREMKGHSTDNMFDMPNIRPGQPDAATKDQFFNSFLNGGKSTKDSTTGGF